MNKYNCNICFDDFDDKAIVMCHLVCENSIICNECYKNYFKHCCDNKNELHCIDNKCNSIYTKILDPNYYNILIGILYNQYINDIKTINTNADYLNKIRTQQMNFINNLPISFQFVIKNSMMNKYKKCVKINKKTIDQSKTDINTSRHCITTICNGFLDVNHTCTKCNTIFCKLCEKTKTSDHLCNKTDVESIELVNSFISCPTCTVKVEKKDGCNDITCANCKTHFCYRTGHRIDTGNHGKFISFDLKQKYNLADMITQDIDTYIRTFIVNIDSLSENMDLIVKKNTNKLIVKLNDLYIKYKDGDTSIDKLSIYKLYMKTYIYKYNRNKIDTVKHELYKLIMYNKLDCNVCDRYTEYLDKNN